MTKHIPWNQLPELTSRKIYASVIAGLAIIIALVLLYGSHRWHTDTKKMHARLESARLPVMPGTYHPDELKGLPEPVQHYFRAVLKDGQPMISAVSVKQAGTFNMSETGHQWKPFSSTQRVITKRPGFDWEGRIRMMPGLTVRVHDAYIEGEGTLHATLFGLVSLADMRGTPELAQGELMRFFAEAAWFPTALLPSQGVLWQAVDDRSARATLKDGATTLTLLFRFGGDGLVESVRADARGRMVNGTVVPTPWEARWYHYEQRHGMLVPLESEVSWLLPEGPHPYWRGRITGIDYEFAH